MKFSTKGWYKVCEEATYFSDDIDDEVLKWDNAKQEYKLRDMEFTAEDFEGAVILTVEEAKALLRRIPEFKESGGWQLPIERLRERIAKAEGK